MFCRVCNCILSNDEEMYAICDDCIADFGVKKYLNSKKALQNRRGLKKWRKRKTRIESKLAKRHGQK